MNRFIELKKQKMKKLNLSYGLVFLLSAIILGGCEDKIPKVVAAFTADTKAKAGELVVFSNESEHADYFQWDFGDGGVAVDRNPSHVYESAGTYTVRLVAIGDGGSDSASSTITVISNVTIDDGIGLPDISLGDNWGTVKATYTSDTAYFRQYIADYGLYQHLVYFASEGVSFVFFTTGADLTDKEEVYVIFVVVPYEGFTKEGIALGDNMTDVVTAYGSPEDESQGSDYSGYWYDTKGIGFFTYNSGNVDEIDIYQPDTGTSKSEYLSGIIRHARELPAGSPLRASTR